MDKICFLFGHSTAPENILPLLEREIEECCLQKEIKTFVVGRRGNFDKLARTAVKAVKSKHSDVKLYLLYCYHPSEERGNISKDFDGSIYPDGMENVPRRFAIVEANQRMVKSADIVICYAEYPGNSRELMGYAQRQGKSIINIAPKLRTAEARLSPTFIE